MYEGTLQGLGALLSEKIYNRSPQAQIERQSLRDMVEAALRRRGISSVLKDADLSSEEAIAETLKKLSVFDPRYLSGVVGIVTAGEQRERARQQHANVADTLNSLAEGGITPEEQAKYVAEQVRNQLSNPETLWRPDQTTFPEYRGGSGKDPRELYNDYVMEALKLGYSAEQAGIAAQRFLKTGVFDLSELGPPAYEEFPKETADYVEQTFFAHPDFVKYAKEHNIVKRERAKGALFPRKVPDNEAVLSYFISNPSEVPPSLRKQFEVIQSLRNRRNRVISSQMNAFEGVQTQTEGETSAPSKGNPLKSR